MVVFYFLTPLKMNAKITHHNNDGCVIEIKIPYGKTMLESEELILKSLNEAGSLATGEALKQFDTDGSPIDIAGQKWTTKGKIFKTYETPYGKSRIERHVYQSSKGGRGHCPLDKKARIIKTATPRCAKILSSKYAEFGSRRVETDLKNNHGLSLPIAYIQNISDIVGSIASIKEDYWDYELPKIDQEISTITFGLDGTCVLMSGDGYRQAMVGTIGFYDKEGVRHHTIYTAASPEYGKKTFLQKLEHEIERVKKEYPTVNYIGIADGAKDNWSFLEHHTKEHILDFYHASEYVGDAGKIMFKNSYEKQNEWMQENCHNLKHEEKYAEDLLQKVRNFEQQQGEELSLDNKDRIQSIITYFTNNLPRMQYAGYTKNNIPIGSGITEAACKVIVKQRLGSSGMRWKDKGASVVLLLRCLSYSSGRWEQFWNKIDKFGFSLAS